MTGWRRSFASVIKRLKLAAGPDRRQVATAAFAALGALWLIVECASFFVSDLDSVKRPAGLAVLVAVAAIVGVVVGVRPRKLTVPLGLASTEVEVEFVDLFGSAASARAIAVNDFFDVELGDPVSATSVHGQFISRCFDGKADELADLIDAALKGKSSKEVTRAAGRNRRYPLGTTVRLEVGQRFYFLFALANTDPKTHKARADVGDVWRALEGLWKEVRVGANGRPVALPLVGAGLSGVGLPHRQLLDVLLASIVEATNQGRVTGGFTVALLPELLDTTDLRDVSARWT
jgi:hypothetical protein